MEENNINMINNDNEKQTPQYDNHIFEFEGELISIDTEVINIVLNDMNNRFILEDFSLYKTEKQVFDYFYNKEQSSLGNIILNFNQNEIQLKFLKYFVNEIIEEKYYYNKSLTEMRNKIDKKINYILEEIEKCKDLNNFNLTERYFQLFKTSKIPKFLEKNIKEEIESIKLINELNMKSEKDNKRYFKENSFKNKNGEDLMTYYNNFITGKSKPFEGGNKEILFEILLYSNLKDIYKSPRIKVIFLNNFLEIASSLDYYEKISEFEEVINNRKEFKFIDDKLLYTFNKYEINYLHLYTIASFFYLVMNQMKDPFTNNKTGIEINQKKINLNNPLFNRILKNILNCFFMYCNNHLFTFETYIYLFNYFSKYIILERNGKKENRLYDTEIIEKKIKNSKNYECIKEFNFIKPKIANIEFLSEFFRKLNNYINLVPLTKKRTSHTITILISGFLSQKDNIDTWKIFYDYDKENSNYYMFKWPSSTILFFLIKSILYYKLSFNSFRACYQKAEYAGRILALFLLNNDEFSDCQINIVGFSLGCHVVLNCLKELNKITNHKFMINNVLLMGGASIIEDFEKDIWRNIFVNNVAGRVINCYSKYDDVLKYLFTICMGKRPIGIGKIDIMDSKGEYPIVDNYDFSDIKLGHLQYRDKFETILKRINFFNWN